MVIAHLITKLELGGAQVNTMHTFRSLDRNRFQVHLLSGPGGLLTAEVEKEENFHLLTCLRRRLNPLLDLAALVQVYRRLRRIKPDLVHTHSAKAGIIGRWAAFLARVPLIVHSVHGFSFSPFHSRSTRICYAWLEKITSLVTDHLVFVAEHDLRLAREMGLGRTGNSLIRSGFPCEPFLESKPENQLKKKLGIPGQNLVCGIIAPMKAQKGLDHLARIAALVLRQRGDVSFLFLGDGVLKDDFRRQLADFGILSNFIMPGFRRDVHRYIALFDLGVSTALWEGLPQSLVQMRLMKKPLVVSNIPGNAEVVHDGGNGFLIPVQEHEKFAEAILCLVEDLNLRKRMADYPDGDFAEWRAENMVRRQEELYLQLSENKR